MNEDTSKLTSGECQTILSALSTVQTANEKSHDDLRTLIHESLSMVAKNIDATAQITNEKLQGINDHFARLNGSVARLQKESDERKIVVEDFRRLEKGLMGMKKKWAYILGGAVLLILMVVVIYDAIGLSGIIQLVK